MVRSDLLNIHQFSQICRTTPRTVRFYEQKGLLKPAFVDPFTKYRYYDKEEQVRQFLRLKVLLNFHVTLGGLKKMVEDGSIETSLEKRLLERQTEIAEQQKELSFLKQMKRFLYDEDDLGKFLKTEYIGPFTVLCRKFKKVDYEKTYIYSQEVQHDAKKFGVSIKDEYLMFYETRYYKPKTSFVEIWQICKSSSEMKKQVSSEYSFKTFPKTKVLMYIYNGPFVYFILLYKKLNEYIDTHHLTKSQSSIDYYLRYQVNSTSEYDYLTKICFPIE